MSCGFGWGSSQNGLGSLLISRRKVRTWGSIRGSVAASGAAWTACVIRIAPRLRVAREEKSFMGNFLWEVHATAQVAREKGLPLLSNDQSDDRSAVSLRES